MTSSQVRVLSSRSQPHPPHPTHPPAPHTQVDTGFIIKHAEELKESPGVPKVCV